MTTSAPGGWHSVSSSRLGGRNIAEISALTLAALREFTAKLPAFPMR